MQEPTALYRCVCGTDVTYHEGESLLCPSCKRRHDPIPREDPVAAETLLLAAGPGDATLQQAATPVGPTGSQREPARLTGKLVDHCEVLEVLGCGGMGTVYRALDRSLQRYVALKVLDSKEALNHAEVEAFTHEARAQARVNHPSVATILAVFLIIDDCWALTNRNRRTIHDHILGTWVLDKV